jgi:prepilin signal peptidase PulO-like enzyme (type II secretory pathway)
MGMGDVKLVFFLGLFLGIFKSTVALFLAFEIGALVGIYLMLSGRAKMKTALPFGPFLILGAVLSLMIV